MTYRVEISGAARREMKALPAGLRARIDAVLLRLAENPRPPGCVKLRNSDFYRLRVVDHRIIYSVHDAILVVYVLRVAHRREVYDNLP